MRSESNPFEYDGANNLSPERILSYYIEDFNYSRFLQSNRNILLVGERGSGKSMALLYNSYEVQSLKDRPKTDDRQRHIGIYVPCNTPLFHKTEHELLEPLYASAISENFFALNMAKTICETLDRVPALVDEELSMRLKAQFEYVFSVDLEESLPLFGSIVAYVDRENREAQQSINNPNRLDFSYENPHNFSSLVHPILSLTRQIPAFYNVHFSILLDDVHMLNDHQAEALASCIAFRDHSLFSFKIAVASSTRFALRTRTGGAILEGHDFTRIDMVKPLHNESTDFGHLAERIVRKRLRQFDISSTPHEFFPEDKKTKDDIEQCRLTVKQEAVALYGPQDKKKISDYVYKRYRARFFRERPPTSNRPNYSGFDILVYMSTGVVRNLLIPCYWMYEKMISHKGSGESAAAGESFAEIPPQVQSETVIEQSRRLWEWVRDEMDLGISGCSREDAVHAYQMLDNLAILFRERMKSDISEPSAHSFTLTGRKSSATGDIEKLLNILREAQLLYVRSGPAKDRGRREQYFVPNRVLWPDRGLDPHGQHARVSIQVEHLWAAAARNKEIPFEVSAAGTAEAQAGLFDD